MDRSKLSFRVWGVNLLITGVTLLVMVAVLIVFDALHILTDNQLGAVLLKYFLAVLVLLVSMLISRQINNKIFLPMRKLSEGTKEIERGNFKVCVENRKPNSEVGQLIANFNHMARELDGIEMFRNDFINNFSHEFKTPLASICGFAERLENEELPLEKRREYSRIIVQESRKLMQMSANILLLSKYENQAMIADREEFSLDEQLRRCLLSMQEQWAQKALEVDVQLVPMQISGNAAMLWQVWANLINNAIKFSPRHSTLHLHCHTEGTTAVVEVSDHGPGMNEETCRHIFEKFYQGDPSHTAEGNGLGLSIVKRIIDLCCGEVHVESVEGVGTTFQVILPDSVVQSK